MGGDGGLKFLKNSTNLTKIMGTSSDILITTSMKYVI
jgi:hypothetical protein